MNRLQIKLDSLNADEFETDLNFCKSVQTLSYETTLKLI